MRMCDIPKNWRNTRPGIWHKPNFAYIWANRTKTKKKMYKVWAIYYEKKCLACRIKCLVVQKWRKYCSNTCANKAIRKFGKDHPRWKNGRCEIKSGSNAGYILIKVGYKKYVFEHRLKIEKYIKRKLLPGEVVHHINGIKNDNKISNLVVMTRKEHLLEHRPGDGNKKIKH